MDGLELKDYLTIFKRRKAYFFTVAFIVFFLSFIFAMKLSNYRSVATIGITAAEVSSDATASNNPVAASKTDIADTLPEVRIGRLQQKVLSVSSLLEVIHKFNLYADLSSTPPEDVAAHMQKKIGVDFINSAVTGPAATPNSSTPIAFMLSFDYSDPKIAQAVNAELVRRFLDEDLKERRNMAHETSQFLDTQIKVLEKAMEEQEKKIADFRAANGDTHPESLAFNQQAAQSISINIQNIDAQIATNETTLGTLRSQMAAVDPYSRVVADGQVLTTPSIQLKALRAQYTTLSSQYGPEHPDVVKLRNQIHALERSTGSDSAADASDLQVMIADTEANLAAAKKTYGPDHPDVVSLQHKLDGLKSKQADATSSGGSYIRNDADNPAYLQIVAALKSAEEQRRALMRQKDTLLAQQEKYQNAIAANPAAEQQLAVLSRDYDNEQQRYRTLKEKKMTADMSEAIEENKSGARLQLINPPDLPRHTQPGRMIYVLGGILLAGVSGLFSVIVAQVLSQSVVGAHHLESLTGVAPIVAIPHISTRAELHEHQQLRDKLTVGAFLAGCVIAAMLFIHYVL